MRQAEYDAFKQKDADKIEWRILLAESTGVEIGTNGTEGFAKTSLWRMTGESSRQLYRSDARKEPECATSGGDAEEEPDESMSGGTAGRSLRPAE